MVNDTSRTAEILKQLDDILSGRVLQTYAGSLAPGFEICSDRPLRHECKPITFSWSAVVAIRDALANRAAAMALPTKDQILRAICEIKSHGSCMCADGAANPRDSIGCSSREQGAVAVLELLRGGSFPDSDPVQAERERCAKIVEKRAGLWELATKEGTHESCAMSLWEECEDIAQAIRNPSKSSGDVK